jgi:hypothetical protein
MAESASSNEAANRIEMTRGDEKSGGDQLQPVQAPRQRTRVATSRETVVSFFRLSRDQREDRAPPQKWRRPGSSRPVERNVDEGCGFLHERPTGYLRVRNAVAVRIIPVRAGGL